MEGEQERELGMQQNHRKHILRNIENLIKCTNYNEIMNETVRRGLFTQKMRQIVENRYNMSEPTDVLHEQHKRYFEKITKRGPRAYDVLKDIVRNLGHIEALRILEFVEDQNCVLPFVSLSSMHRNNNSIKEHSNPTRPLTPYTEPVVGPTRVVVKSDRIHSDELVGTYTMQSQHDRGVLLIVNLIDFLNPKKVRSGAEVDGQSLIHVFREMGFTIFYYKNLKGDEFFTTLSLLTDSEYVRRTECFAMVLMTHGERSEEKDRVEFSDGSISDVKTILDHFQADKCPHLIGKPKVLIFPFCRGERPDHGQIVPKSIPRMHTQTDGMLYNDVPLSSNVPLISNVPTLSDLLVCYASTAGYETHRDPEAGSWYIQKLCNMMAEHAHNTSLEDILKKSQMTVGNMRTEKGNLQTGEYNNLGFNKKLYFNPGFYLKPNTISAGQPACEIV